MLGFCEVFVGFSVVMVRVIFHKISLTDAYSSHSCVERRMRMPCAWQMCFIRHYKQYDIKVIVRIKLTLRRALFRCSLHGLIWFTAHSVWHCAKVFSSRILSFGTFSPYWFIKYVFYKKKYIRLDVIPLYSKLANKIRNDLNLITFLRSKPFRITSKLKSVVSLKNFLLSMYCHFTKLKWNNQWGRKT